MYTHSELKPQKQSGLDLEWEAKDEYDDDAKVGFCSATVRS